MQLIIGADGRPGDQRVASLVRRLAFQGVPGQGCQVDIVSVVESLPYLAGSTPELGSPELLEQLMARQEEESIRAANKMAEAVQTVAVRCRTMVRQGSAIDQLLAHAEDSGADLIAVGGAQQSELAAFLTGSVGRGLVIGAKQSILVVKGEIAPEGGIKAVLATDHSHYADRCIERLLAFAPQGIEHLTVLTAYPKENIFALRPLLPEFVVNPAEWVIKNLEERNQQVIERLKPLGCSFESVVTQEQPNPAISRAMQERGGDLLILGARGHGFIERLTMGSVSFHQVVAEPCSVLVLRTEDIKE